MCRGAVAAAAVCVVRWCAGGGGGGGGLVLCAVWAGGMRYGYGGTIAVVYGLWSLWPVCAVIQTIKNECAAALARSKKERQEAVACSVVKIKAVKRRSAFRASGARARARACVPPAGRRPPGVPCSVIQYVPRSVFTGVRSVAVPVAKRCALCWHCRCAAARCARESVRRGRRCSGRWALRLCKMCWRIAVPAGSLASVVEQACVVHRASCIAVAVHVAVAATAIFFMLSTVKRKVAACVVYRTACVLRGRD